MGRLIIRRTIADNARPFINILFILFDVSRVMDIWNNLAVTDINEFYDVLKKIDKESRFSGLENETDKLASIRAYYGNLKNELQKEQYDSINLDLDQMFSDAEIIFEICEFWNNIEYTINSINQEDDRLLLKKYFLLETGYQPRENALHSVSDLIEALTALKRFYTSKGSDYESNYSNLLTGLAYRIALQCEQQPAWFGDKKEEIFKLLSELAEMVGRLDNSSGYYEKDTVTKIKIYVYKFSEFCRKEETERREDLKE